MSLNPIFRESFDIVEARIRSLKPIHIKQPFQDATMGPFDTYTITTIELKDASGAIGEGPIPLSTGRHVLEKCFMPIVLSEGAQSYPDLLYQLYWSIRNEGFRGPASNVLGGLDLAFYDLAARREKKPIHQYLGANRNWAKVYGSGCGTNYTDEEIIREMEFFLRKEVDTVKMKIGKNYGRAMKDDLRRIKLVRDIIGKNTKLAIDANQVWTTEEALSFAAKAEVFDIAWFEEPVHSADLQAIGQLCEATPIPVSFGESERSGKTITTLLEKGVHHIQPILGYTSTLQEWFDARDATLALNRFFSSGGYSQHTCQFVATCPEICSTEMLYALNSELDPYFSVKPVFEKGVFTLPNEPGSSAQVDWEQAAKNDRIALDIQWSKKDFSDYKAEVIL